MRQLIIILLAVAWSGVALSQTPAAGKFAAPDWVATSNAYTHQLLDVQFQHSPESGSAEAQAQYDALITDPSRADELAARKQYQAVLANLKAAQVRETNKHVSEDLEILRKAFDLQFRQEDYANRHLVPFTNASQEVFQGLTHQSEI